MSGGFHSCVEKEILRVVVIYPENIVYVNKEIVSFYFWIDEHEDVMETRPLSCHLHANNDKQMLALLLFSV